MNTYYGSPALKPSPYRWKVALYTFLGGLAGSAQVLATFADLIGRRRDRRMVRAGRAIAAATGAVIGPALLIADLHTPQRWPIGSYVLTAFGAFSSLALIPRVGKLAQLPAAFAGAGMASYTPALLAATATPLWYSAPEALATEFACAAFASGAAALLLAQPSRALEYAACTATVAYGTAAAAARRLHARAQVDRPLQRGKWATMHKAGLGLGVALPLACFAMNAVLGRSRERAVLGAAGILAGVWLSRWALLAAGNESARRAAAEMSTRRW